MHFTAPPEHYDRFMGRYSRNLAPQLADLAGIERGQRVLDVGCGPGSLTTVLAERVGEDHVAAVDPAEQFAAAARERVPGADVRVGAAEELPWGDDSFDAALACLVIAFMRDADQGVAEMVRVTRPGGVVAACHWDLAQGGMTMLSLFWQAMRQEAPTGGEGRLAGTSPGDIAARFERAGLIDIDDTSLTARADYADFDDFWQPFTLAVGLAGSALAALPEDARERVRETCREKLPPEGPFTLEARAWAARGTVPAEG